ncbi:hypothetical protein ACN47E_010217 [Coniothyrium glycines]
MEGAVGSPNTVVGGLEAVTTAQGQAGTPPVPALQAITAGHREVAGRAIQQQIRQPHEPVIIAGINLSKEPIRSNLNRVLVKVTNALRDEAIAAAERGADSDETYEDDTVLDVDLDVHVHVHVHVEQMPTAETTPTLCASPVDSTSSASQIAMFPSDLAAPDAQVLIEDLLDIQMPPSQGYGQGGPSTPPAPRDPFAQVGSHVTPADEEYRQIWEDYKRKRVSVQCTLDGDKFARDLAVLEQLEAEGNGLWQV